MLGEVLPGLNQPLRFTKGSSPFENDVLRFVLAENIQCPMNLPMLMKDANLTVTTCHAAIHDPSVPISEYIKKEFFYRCYMGFSTAIGAGPSLIADEVRRKCRQFDYQFGTVLQKTRAEREADMKFTQGDFRRFCLLFYLLTRKLLQAAEILVLRDGRKRIMPRHLLNAAIVTGIIPYRLYAS